MKSMKKLSMMGENLPTCQGRRKRFHRTAIRDILILKNWPKKPQRGHLLKWKAGSKHSKSLQLIKFYKPLSNLAVIKAGSQFTNDHRFGIRLGSTKSLLREKQNLNQRFRTALLSLRWSLIRSRQKKSSYRGPLMLLY